MSFYSDQAAQFLQMAQDIQTRLTNEGAAMDGITYTSLEEQRDTLQDKADAMITADIQATLAQLKVDQPRLAACTASLVDAVKTVKKFDQIVAIVSSAVVLATAIASANLGGIASAVVGAEQAVAAALPKAQVIAMPAAESGNGLAIAASGDSSDSSESST
jgi:hypothetical protein